MIASMMTMLALLKIEERTKGFETVFRKKVSRYYSEGIDDPSIQKRVHYVDLGAGLLMKIFKKRGRFGVRTWTYKIITMEYPEDEE